jgi:hypothetical protein
MPLSAARVLPATSMDFADGAQRFNWCRCNSSAPAAAPGVSGLGAVNCDPFWSQMNGGVCSDANGNPLRADGSAVDSFETLRFFSGGGGQTTAPAPGVASSIVSTAAAAKSTASDLWEQVKQNEALVYGALGLAVALLIKGRR